MNMPLPPPPLPALPPQQMLPYVGPTTFAVTATVVIATVAAAVAVAVVVAADTIAVAVVVRRWRRRVAAAAACGPSPLEVTSDGTSRGEMNRYVKEYVRTQFDNVEGTLYKFVSFYDQKHKIGLNLGLKIHKFFMTDIFNS